jgi:hypothetical protein
MIRAMQAKKISTPAAANNWLRMMRMLTGDESR